MEPLQIIILSVIILYLVSGAIFCYFSFKYRKSFRRIKCSANILIRDLNEDLTKIKQTCDKNKVCFNYTPFNFPSANDDEINENREHIYTSIDKARELARVSLLEIKNVKDKEKVENILVNIDNNLTTYRRLVLKHNKVIDNYNYNSQSLLFIVFAKIMGLSREDHI